MTPESTETHDVSDAETPSENDQPSSASSDAKANSSSPASGSAPEEAPNTEAREATADASDDPHASGDAEEALEEEAQQKIARLEEENEQLNDRLLRTAAEFENFRRRAKRQKERRYEAGKVDAIRTLLDVLDDFERSVDAADKMEDVQDLETAYTSLKGGIEMVVQKFRDELKGLGVTPIKAEGEAFDESLHEAMMQQPADDVEPGTVVQEIRKGYRLDDRVIRHSRVIVASDSDA